MQKFPAAIQDFAETFIWLQRRRHLADYDPEFPFCKSEVIGDIQRVRKAIARFSKAPAKDRRAFAIHVLMKARPNA